MLVKYGKEIEVYGSINYEYGIIEFYVLNVEGEFYFELIDFEVFFNIECEEEIIVDWLGLIFDEIKIIYFEVFEDNQEEDD